MDDHTTTAERFKALGDTVRVRMMELLPTRCECSTATNVSDLAKALEISQCNASHHLRILYQSGLIRSKRVCREVYYYIDVAATSDLMKTFTEKLAAHTEAPDNPEPTEDSPCSKQVPEEQKIAD